MLSFVVTLKTLIFDHDLVNMFLLSKTLNAPNFIASKVSFIVQIIKIFIWAPGPDDLLKVIRWHEFMFM